MAERATKDSPENTNTPGAVSPPTETDGNARTGGDRIGDPPSGKPLPKNSVPLPEKPGLA